MWGFITVINNTLLPHLRSVFALNYFQTTLIESVWFIGYLVASIPAALLIASPALAQATGRAWAQGTKTKPGPQDVLLVIDVPSTRCVNSAVMLGTCVKGKRADK